MPFVSFLIAILIRELVNIMTMMIPCQISGILFQTIVFDIIFAFLFQSTNRFQ